MKESARQRFDELLEEVLSQMPPLVHELIERVPLHVEDYPSRDIIHELGLEYRDDLCGLYTGIPLTEPHRLDHPRLPDVVTIYREGIVAAATRRDGRVPLTRLKREIHKTILHELAHHHGMTEEQIRELGYG